MASRHLPGRNESSRKTRSQADLGLNLSPSELVYMAAHEDPLGELWEVGPHKHPHQTILLVDNDSERALQLQLELGENEFKVICVSALQDTLNVIKEGRVDLLLLSPDIADCNSRDFLKSVRQTSQGAVLPVIALVEAKGEADMNLLVCGADLLCSFNGSFNRSGSKPQNKSVQKLVSQINLLLE